MTGREQRSEVLASVCITPIKKYSERDRKNVRCFRLYGSVGIELLERQRERRLGYEAELGRVQLVNVAAFRRGRLPEQLTADSVLVACK